jgi:hypothetical protein
MALYPTITLADFAQRAAAAVAAGTVTRAEAERAAGYMLLELADAPHPSSRTTEWRRDKLLRRIAGKDAVVLA